jgi:predicted Zn-dependent protease
MLDPDRARRLAETALSASTADSTEVCVELLEQELNRFTHEHPVQNQLRNLARVAVRVHVDGREGKATTGTVTEDAVRRTVEQAVAVARHMPPAKDGLLDMAGEQVEHACAFNAEILDAMAENVKNRFTHAVARGPDRMGFRRSKGGSAKASGDDPHFV